ncbi:MAG: hypothetical protein KJ630_17665 [Proteobacteria bacterium]|nr:hypothetical protein [Pseudomonadota bacterium]
MRLELDIDHQEIIRMIGLAHATDMQIEAARMSTLRKMRRLVEARVKRYAAKELRIPQRGIEHRFFAETLKPGDEELRLWIGTWNISPFSIGTPTAYGVPGKTGGVRVGRSRNYPGAFMARIYTARDKVWIRLGSKHYSDELYPTRYRPGDRGLTGLRGRFPVVRAAVPIDYTIKAVLEKHESEFSGEFSKIFARELNYFVNIKGQG